MFYFSFNGNFIQTEKKLFYTVNFHFRIAECNFDPKRYTNAYYKRNLQVNNQTIYKKNKQFKHFPASFLSPEIFNFLKPTTVYLK